MYTTAVSNKHHIKGFPERAEGAAGLNFFSTEERLSIHAIAKTLNRRINGKKLVMHRKGSGWTFTSFLHFTLRTIKNPSSFDY